MCQAAASSSTRTTPIRNRDCGATASIARLRRVCPSRIEQDLAWFCEPPAPCRSVLSHDPPFTGEEPTLRDYFFERIRPIVERALAAGDRRDWPIITLNLDFKSDEPEHHAAVWALLGEHEAWLTTAAAHGER